MVLKSLRCRQDLYKIYQVLFLTSFVSTNHTERKKEKERERKRMKGKERERKRKTEKDRERKRKKEKERERKKKKEKEKRREIEIEKEKRVKERFDFLAKIIIIQFLRFLILIY